MVDKRQISKYASQYIDEKDISFVVETLKGDFITQGNTVTNFEASLKKFLNLKLDSMQFAFLQEPRRYILLIYH